MRTMIGNNPCERLLNEAWRSFKQIAFCRHTVDREAVREYGFSCLERAFNVRGNKHYIDQATLLAALLVYVNETDEETEYDRYRA